MSAKRGHDAATLTEIAAGEVARFGPDQSALREVVRDPQPVAWVYLGLDSLGEDERDLRRRTVLERIAADGAPQPAIDAVSIRLQTTSEAPLTLSLFVSADGTVLHSQAVPRDGLPDAAGWTAPPPLVPLLARAQGRPPYVLVVIDRAGAELSSSAGGDALVRTETVEGPDDEIERNAPGGWQGLTQGRYQHRAEDSWMHNARHVAAATVARIAEVGAQVLVVSGDVRAEQLLLESLPPLPGVLIRHINGSRAADGSQAGRRERVEEAIRDAVAEQNRLVLKVLQENLEPGGRGVSGWADTVDALAAGRVAMLLVSEGRGDGRRVWFGAGATDVFRDHEAAALTRRPVQAGGLVDVAVRAALLSGARVRVLPEGTAGAPRDGIGAVCRFGGT